jgi:four helix bundle protein
MKDKIKTFYDMEVWKRANAFTVRVYQVTNKFPRDERFGLTDQMRKATSSISANIAEGFNRYHPNDKIRFYHNARGSAGESKSHIILSKDLKYIADTDAHMMIGELGEIEMMINGLINSLRRLASSRAP